jgi:hypothetical protein
MTGRLLMWYTLARLIYCWEKDLHYILLNVLVEAESKDQNNWGSILASH